jgi:AcrR family transcriptional regulator
LNEILVADATTMTEEPIKVVEKATIDEVDTAAKLPSNKSRPRDGSMRARFVSATTALLRESGPAGASIRAICDMVGVKPPTLYHYFGDLETLRNSVLDTVVTEYFKAKNARPGSRDPFTRLRNAWDNFVAFSIDEPYIYTLLVQQHFSGHLPQSIIDAHSDLTNDLREIAQIQPLRHLPEMSSQMFTAALLGTVAMLAAQNAGLPKVDHLGAVMREETFRAILG